MSSRESVLQELLEHTGAVVARLSPELDPNEVHELTQLRQKLVESFPKTVEVMTASENELLQQLQAYDEQLNEWCHERQLNLIEQLKAFRQTTEGMVRGPTAMPSPKIISQTV